MNHPPPNPSAPQSTEDMNQALEQIRSERDRYLLLFDEAPNGYLILNDAMEIMAANLAFCTLTNQQREQIIGQPMRSLIHEPDQNQCCVLVDKLQDKHGHAHMDLRLLQGQEDPIEVRMDWAIQDNSRDHRYHISVIDNREQKRLERQRKLFMSIINHELRTPLTNIQLSLEMLASDAGQYLSPSALDMIRTAQRSSKRLQKLVTELNDMGQAESGELSIHPRPLSILPLIEEAMRATEQFAQRFNVTLLLQPNLEPIRVLGDDTRLLQVLINLINNAIRFTPEGGKVHIRLSRDERMGFVRVTDHGSGIAKADRPFVFEPFFQAQHALEDSRNDGTTGLGLAISRRIVQRLNGKIGFESEPGIRTTFWFELPLLNPKPIKPNP